MADISFNNITNPQSIVIFDGVPNIINVNEEIYGSNAVVTISVNQSISSTYDGQYSIVVMGETITNVVSQANETGKRFKLYTDKGATALSIASALRNCQRLISLFSIYATGTTVVMNARAIGRLNVTASTDIPNNAVTISVSDGEIYSQLYGQKISADMIVNGEYRTTLEKRMYGDNCSFDVSGALAPYSKEGVLTPFTFTLKAIDTSGVLVPLGTVSGDTTTGYLLKGSDNYLYNTEPQLMLGRKEGLTIYGDVMEVSVLSPSGFQFMYEVLAPDGTVLESSTESVSSYGITDMFFWIGQNAMLSGTVVNISAGTDTASYRIVKPLKAAEDYERVCWRNEVGGVSFFDFTGRDSETFSISKNLYNKSWFDFYTNDSFEHEKMSENDTRTEFTLRSHLLTQDEAEQFRSLSRASSVWLVKKEWNEVTEEMEMTTDRRHIILTGLEVTENDTYPGVFSATLKFKLSSEK